jgi:tRNA/tmRNA/rRNA uracil-C5-methylase (TrmA/RlmC/RlmD family)
VGTIGLSLLDLLSSLVCSDENPYNEDCFARALASLPEQVASKARYVPYDASKMMREENLISADILLVDPPRKGLDLSVVAALSRPCRYFARGGCNYGDKCKNSHLPNHLKVPKTIFYVSCGFKALKRDLTALKENGWKIEHAEGHVLFPGADHIEVLVKLQRNY